MKLRYDNIQQTTSGNSPSLLRSFFLLLPIFDTLFIATLFSLISSLATMSLMLSTLLESFLVKDSFMAEVIHLLIEVPDIIKLVLAWKHLHGSFLVCFIHYFI